MRTEGNNPFGTYINKALTLQQRTESMIGLQFYYISPNLDVKTLKENQKICTFPWQSLSPFRFIVLECRAKTQENLSLSKYSQTAVNFGSGSH